VRIFFCLVVIFIVVSTSSCRRDELIIERNVDITMRDGVVLRADIYRPPTNDPLPVLVYRTPYGKHLAVDEYHTHLSAVERGYVVVLQDVRGRYASDGFFDPYRNEGHDGFDTIEWAAEQPWSNGEIGTYGLSYPGAVQWLAAVESPPHLKAMAPAMTFSTPGNFFYMNGVFDLSWLPWVYSNIAPDARVRRGIDGPVSEGDVAERWAQEADDILSYLPLADLPQLRDEAPFYFEWLRHPPGDPWWEWAEIRGKYEKTEAAVLNLSGWYDEAYGPEGATTNFAGLVAAREKSDTNAHLVLGPWKHGVASVALRSLGELDFGPNSSIDYDAELMDFFDRHLKQSAANENDQPSVRYFVMGANEWRTSDVWPPAETTHERLCLTKSLLADCNRETDAATTTFTADPNKPVVDPYGTFAPNDLQQLADRDDVIVFDSAPLEKAITVAGNSTARLFVSCDCADFDLWVRLMDVHPDGRAINLMSPGADVQRVSLRDNSTEPQLLEAGEVYAVNIDGLLTANRFEVGHKIRIQVSASYAPFLSRNLQTGESEIWSSKSSPAQVTVHHNEQYPSSLTIPTIQ